MKNFTLTKQLPVAARTVYHAWLDSGEHSAMTGGEAQIEPKIGSEFSAWDGYISGKLTSLVEGTEITQTWRTSNFAEEDEDSLLQILLKDNAEGCELTLVHSNIPDDGADYYTGWQEHYFEPMASYFSEGAKK